jgi:hypothetical protein
MNSVIVDYIFEKEDKYYDYCKNDKIQKINNNSKIRILYIGQNSLYLEDLFKNEEIKNICDIESLNIENSFDLFYYISKDNEKYHTTILICYKHACNIFNYYYHEFENKININKIIFIEPIKNDKLNILKKSYFNILKTLPEKLDKFYFDEDKIKNKKVFRKTDFFLKNKEESPLLSENLIKYLKNYINNDDDLDLDQDRNLDTVSLD